MIRVLAGLALACGFAPVPSRAAAADATPKVSVTPATAVVQYQHRVTFKAKVTPPDNVGVDWLVNDVVGGSEHDGRIDEHGVYNFNPALVRTTPVVVTISARARASHHAIGTAKVTLINAPPEITSIEPQPVVPGPAVLTINGRLIMGSYGVMVGNVPFTVVHDSWSRVRAYGVIPPNVGTRIPVRISDPGPIKRFSKPRGLAIDKRVKRSVTLDPGAASVRCGEQLEFSAMTVGGMPNNPYTWTVNGVRGGTDLVGHIDDYGTYTAPDQLPTPNTVTIDATTETMPAATGAATVTLLPPFPRPAAVFPSGVRPGSFSIVVRGSGFMPGSVVLLDGAALATTFTTAHTLTATGTAVRGATRKAELRVRNPAPGNDTSTPITLSVLSDPAHTTYRASAAEAARLLDQATFGPGVSALDRVRELGREGWLDEQLALPESSYPDLPANERMAEDLVQRTALRHALGADDQLRQRMVFALGQLFVVSDSKLHSQTALLEWQRMLSRQAFGNYRTLLEAVTLSPVMGHYLDLANSEKDSTDGMTSANENYPREVLQLFSIGLAKLNPDGSVQLDAAGQPIATYDQGVVHSMARAMTGWGYPTAPGQAFTWPTKLYFRGNMRAFEPVHDTGAKTLLDGFVLPAGGSTTSDMQAALDNIFHHPNVGPFIATRLIRHFVTSNPSPGYVQRVAAAFDDDGRGTRGNLAATLKAVLLDPEAQDATVTDASGKLREPILYFTAALRALDGQLAADAPLRPGLTREMSERVLESPSVFNFFSPQFRAGGTGGLYGPEFQIYTPVTAVARANWLFRYLNQSYSGELYFDIEPFRQRANDPASQIDLVNERIFAGRMSTALRNQLIDAVARHTPDVNRRTMSALWLALNSGEYLVQH